MIISIGPVGNIGNRMIQYMAAITLGQLLGDDITWNVDLPEWGMTFDRPLHDRLRNDPAQALLIHDSEATSPLEILRRIRAADRTAIVFQGVLQRLDLLHAPDFYRNIFPLPEAETTRFDADELVINIRAGELRYGGADWYPLVPPQFYADLIARTRLRPVLLGQLDDGAYLDEIHALLPGARLLPSAGPMTDLARLRRAPNLCIAVSTFSWLAAYLSEASVIHYPILGFLHPGRFPPGVHSLGGIDLAPADDPRFRFHLFPIIAGDAETRYLEHVRTISPISREIPRTHVHLLKQRRPILPRATDVRMFDPPWYLRTCIDAAWRISEGWYHDALDHYLQIGKTCGYLPHKPLYQPETPEIARGKSATQSSLSHWSIGRTIAEDAGRALDGDLFKPMAFHTDINPAAWWMVDLGSLHDLECVNIYNRYGELAVRRRARHLAIELSTDAEHWITVARTEDDDIFGTETAPDRSIPFQWIAEPRRSSRYLRISQLVPSECLHLAAVEIYGRKPDDEQ